MLRKLRREAQEALYVVPAQRRPALRRWDGPEALLATDLPGIARPENVTSLVRTLENKGWRVWQKNGWLLMDHAVPAPEEAWPQEYPGEWGCCLWLLRCHPGGEAPAEYVRALVKATEQGREQVERLCKTWHGEFAAMLRAHQPLPGELAPYLTAAMKEEA